MQQPIGMSVMNALNKLSESVYTYPVRWSAFVRASVLVLTAFGMHLTSEQIAALMMFVEAALAIFTHNQVTPNVKL